jgi:hypothetical protein
MMVIITAATTRQSPETALGRERWCRRFESQIMTRPLGMGPRVKGMEPLQPLLYRIPGPASPPFFFASLPQIGAYKVSCFSVLVFLCFA